jgi:hypothetical protein
MPRANAVRKQMVHLSRKVGVHLQPVFTSCMQKIGNSNWNRGKWKCQLLINNASCINFNVICVMRIISAIQRDISTNALLSINHDYEAHGNVDLLNESRFQVLRKCQNKFDCLVYEMLYIISYWILLSPIWQNIKSRLQYCARPKVEPNIEVET